MACTLESIDGVRVLRGAHPSTGAPLDIPIHHINPIPLPVKGSFGDVDHILEVTFTSRNVIRLRAVNTDVLEFCIGSNWKFVLRGSLFDAAKRLSVEIPRVSSTETSGLSNAL